MVTQRLIFKEFFKFKSVVSLPQCGSSIECTTSFFWWFINSPKAWVVGEGAAFSGRSEVGRSVCTTVKSSGVSQLSSQQSAPLRGAGGGGLVCEWRRMTGEWRPKAPAPRPGLMGRLRRVLGARPGTCPHPAFQLHQGPRPEPQRPSPVTPCWGREKTAQLLSQLLPSWENSFASLSAEPTVPTVPIVNQELREIFKIKSETTGYVQEGDDYAWDFYQSQLFHSVCLLSGRNGPLKHTTKINTLAAVLSSSKGASGRRRRLQAQTGQGPHEQPWALALTTPRSRDPPGRTLPAPRSGGILGSAAVPAKAKRFK